jgi:Uma2 family endonuclease
MSNTMDDGYPLLPMTREEYRAWAEQQPTGRFERINGIVVAMAPERVSHARIKARLWMSLDRAVRLAGIACEALPDGITIEVDESDYQPDAIVQCGPLDPNAVSVDNPVIIAEVLSPSTARFDRTQKLRDYFSLPTVHHYLIAWPDKPQIVHHRRGDDGTIETRIITTGAIDMAPPGITIFMEEIYL